ncbi:MAG: hypothetical protein K2W82_17310 [Candidatus Obscuribacterales bacterium]|nr:hypothetical protein [Candidatus Obscuribacterales bacterium]
MATQRRLGMVGCGTPEIMLQSQIRQALSRFEGVIRINFKNDKTVVVHVATEAYGEALPKTCHRRKVLYVVAGGPTKKDAQPPKPAPCLIGNNSPAEKATRDKIRKRLRRCNGVSGIIFKGRTEVEVRVKTKADGEALPKTCQGRKVSYKVLSPSRKQLH